jgi:hypothetical protein
VDFLVLEEYMRFIREEEDSTLSLKVLRGLVYQARLLWKRKTSWAKRSEAENESSSTWERE